MTINEILQSLRPVDRAAIMAAFEAGETHYVEYAPGLFVGVNTDVVPHLHATQEAGYFKAGTIANARPEAR